MEAGHHGADGSVQPSLLRGIVMEKPVPRAFDLDFVESTAFEKEKENRFRPLSLKKSRSNAPPPKRPCLHPSENQAVNNDPDRFDFSKDDAYSEMSVQYGIKCRERTQRVATSGSRTSVRAGTPRSCATKPRPHATSKAKNGRGCFLPFFRFQHLAGFIFAEKSVQWKAERQMSKASFVARN